MWIREYVTNHPLYKHDSIINEQIQYDLISFIQKMTNHQQDINMTLTND
jgi:hypothetical protein